MLGATITNCLARFARACARSVRPALAFSALLALAFVFAGRGGIERVEAAPVNLNVHVHDNFYHPAGAFIVGTGTSHPVAQAACQKADPDATCDAQILQGDTITWVAPAPLAVNEHTVTECTDNTFTVCGAAVAALNPIDDSGVRQPPPATAPTGWPYGPVQFNNAGVFYYRCEVHPDVMRGRIVVSPNVVAPIPVGGEAQIHLAPMPKAQEGQAPAGSRLAVIVSGGGAALVLLLAVAGVYARRRTAGDR